MSAAGHHSWNLLTANFPAPRIAGRFCVVSPRAQDMRVQEPITIDRLHITHHTRRKEIRARLREFDSVWQSCSDARLWEEMVYCIFTAGSSATMGATAVDAVRPLLGSGSRAAI